MPINHKLLRSLYLQNNKSMAEIATILDCSIHKVVYWMQAYGIERRTQSDANYVKYNPHGDPFSIKDNLSVKDIKLYYLALGLYWGEGGKRNKNSVRMGNSDADMLILWIQFLKTICNISPDKIHYHLQTFKDINSQVALQFWASKLNIPTSRITTCRPIPPLGKGNYKKISLYGVMTIGVYNIHFREWLMEQLYKLGYNPNL